MELRLQELEIEIEKLRYDWNRRSICQKMIDYIFLFYSNKRQQWSKCP